MKLSPIHYSLSTNLIVALDVDSKEKAYDLIDLLSPKVKFYKVGSLFSICGPEIIEYINKKGAQVFLDMKWYDIPQTVSNWVKSSTALSVSTVENSFKLPQIFMMTVHAQGSKEMLEAAAQTAREKAEELKIKKPLIVGVTVLTSENYDNVESVVLERAKKAKDAGLDGIVCSVHEAALVRKELGKDFIIVTPGIRLPDAGKDDQKRVATSGAAVKAGANFIVVGRPIIEAKDPLAAAEQIFKDITNVTRNY